MYLREGNATRHFDPFLDLAHTDVFNLHSNQTLEIWIFKKKKQQIFLSHFLRLDNLSICSSQQLDSVVVKLHTFGAGVTSLIPTQYPVKGPA